MNPAANLQASSSQWREDMVLELSLNPDIDRRRRPRNRPTQSCLNCHTSKRKCDRKRPCSRCIQLGLVTYIYVFMRSFNVNFLPQTGLCIYEVDDPALRDNPNIDETTRLRNRIAELESVLREIRGKPHPRWAETAYRGGDVHEKWHSRTKLDRMHQSQDPAGVESLEVTARVPGSHHAEGLSYISSMVKAEPAADILPNYLYSLPDPSFGRSSNFQTAQSIASHAYGANPREEYPQRSRYPTDSVAYCHPSSDDSSDMYAECYRSGAHQYLDDEQCTDFYGSPRTSLDSEASSSTCSCLTNPAFARPLAAFMTQLRATAQLLQHASGDHDQQECLILAHMIELDAIMRGGISNLTAEYCPSPASVESGVMPPVSTLSQESGSSISSDEWTPQSGNLAYFHTYVRTR
ncbi:uncharacterized protein LAESUDRAFT_323655 [Laetiporus sulphureus 93-53]|uniref:Zn(2)-C6 fungal-type domain-containing protein n=1 Tax=Laetiporus sulphureus 93-53 TaxID=1314785 RepID=A0A165CYD2_9APHY|nr:uncharacterized protein LAESUDRAFT_323655 [Laetiporus sulphureus 93-53]KZT03741.1 hypothetical protein LAESUDRAFT_323655 [Laetiporus sulphureus 93-53]